MSNTKLWNELFATDPKHTKKVSFGRGFTAIDPMWQIKRMTEVFGSVGEGWGYEVSDPIPVDNKTIGVKITMWHTDKNNKWCHYGQASLYTDKNQSKPDIDCLKKATTDGMTKCFSILGLSADVFLGMFDDVKYVEEQTNKIKAEQEKDKVAVIIDNIMECKDATSLEAQKELARNEARSLSAGSINAIKSAIEQQQTKIEKGEYND
jgi:hypothetical protein